jgi:hypothetical protein
MLVARRARLLVQRVPANRFKGLNAAANKFSTKTQFVRVGKKIADVMTYFALLASGTALVTSNAQLERKELGHHVAEQVISKANSLFRDATTPAAEALLEVRVTSVILE